MSARAAPLKSVDTTRVDVEGPQPRHTLEYSERIYKSSQKALCYNSHKNAKQIGETFLPLAAVTALTLGSVFHLVLEDGYVCQTRSFHV